MTDDHKALVEALSKSRPFRGEYDDEAAAAIASLSEQLERAEADAERYRWLRDKCDHVYDGSLTVAEVTTWGLDAWSGDNLNAAIDSARKESHE